MRTLFTFFSKYNQAKSHKTLQAYAPQSIRHFNWFARYQTEQSDNVI